jgi:hypothetical protein
MFANNNMLFVMLNGKADALGDLSATNTSGTTFAGAGMIGLCGGCGCRQGHEHSSAIHGRDDRLACGRRICNRCAHRPYVDRLSVWADAGFGIGLHYVRHDARCRRSFVGESFRLRTFLIRGEPFIAHAFVRALMRTAPCWKSFQLRPRVRETRATSWA